MRGITTKGTPGRNRRRGLSFIEVITSLVMIAMMITIVVAMVGVMRGNMQTTMAYTDMKMYGVNTLETLQMDLEQGVQIDAENYNDDGADSGIRADVYVTDIGMVHGKPMYRVDIEMYHREAGVLAKTEAVLREGCIAYAP